MAEPPVENYQIGDPQLDPSELTTETLMDMTPSQPAQTEQINDDNPVFSERGGGVAMTTTAPDMGGRGGFDVKAFGPGPKVKGGGGIGAGVGTGGNAGSGGDGTGFGGRGTGMRKAMLGRYGGTKAHRASGRCRALLAGQASNERRQLEPRKIHHDVQGQILHRRRKPGIALRRHGHGLAAVFGGRANPECEWAISTDNPRRGLLACQPSKERRRFVG